MTVIVMFFFFPLFTQYHKHETCFYAQNNIFDTMGCLSLETPITCIKIKYLCTWLLIINGPHRTGAIHILIRVSLKFSSFPDDKEKVFCCICRYTPWRTSCTKFVYTILLAVKHSHVIVDTRSNRNLTLA